MQKSKKYIQTFMIFIFYTIAIWLSFFITRVMLGSEVYGGYMISVIVISMVSALIPSIGRFIGRRKLFIVSTLSILAGILYMFYVVIGNTTPGWGDLTSIVGYLFIVGFGFVLALLVEVISYFVKIKQK